VYKGREWSNCLGSSNCKQAARDHESCPAGVGDANCIKCKTARSCELSSQRSVRIAMSTGHAQLYVR
jgi:hypothetical protein